MAERLTVVRHGNDATEWRVEAPFLGFHDIVPTLILGAGCAWLARNFDFSWEHAIPLAALATLLVLVLQNVVAVHSESLTLTPGVGVRLETRRRAGPQPAPRLLALHQLDGLLLDEDMSSRRKRYLLALPLNTAAGGAPAAADGVAGGGAASAGNDGDDDELVQAELVFPNLRPRLAVLQQVHQQAQPLLEAELRRQKPAGGAAGAGAVGAAEAKKER